MVAILVAVTVWVTCENVVVSLPRLYAEQGVHHRARDGRARRQPCAGGLRFHDLGHSYGALDEE